MPETPPSACCACGIARQGHGRQWTEAAGWHPWTQPTQEQIKDRMLARRDIRNEDS